MDGKSGETMQSLPDTLSSLMGFNKYLTPNWIESVSHIIKELSPTKSNTKAMVRPAQNIGRDDTESDTKVAKIQGMQFYPHALNISVSFFSFLFFFARITDKVVFICSNKSIKQITQE